MSEYINCFIGREDAEWFQEMKNEARTRAIHVTTFPVRMDDIEVSMRIRTEDELSAERLQTLMFLKDRFEKEQL